MSASQNNLSLIVNQQDSSGVNIVNRLVGAIQYSGIDGQFTIGKLTSLVAQTQTFPSMITTVLQYYIKNTSTGAQVITVTWTRTTGASAVVISLPPGSSIAFWETASTSPAGITALSLQTDVVDATFEQFIGG